jgi:hypothetical protein
MSGPPPTKRPAVARVTSRITAVLTLSAVAAIGFRVWLATSPEDTDALESPLMLSAALAEPRSDWLLKDLRDGPIHVVVAPFGSLDIPGVARSLPKLLYFPKGRLGPLEIRERFDHVAPDDRNLQRQEEGPGRSASPFGNRFATGRGTACEKKRKLIFDRNRPRRSVVSSEIAWRTVHDHGKPTGPLRTAEPIFPIRWSLARTAPAIILGMYQSGPNDGHALTKRDGASPGHGLSQPGDRSRRLHPGRVRPPGDDLVGDVPADRRTLLRSTSAPFE